MEAYHLFMAFFSPNVRIGVDNIEARNSKFETNQNAPNNNF